MRNCTYPAVQVSRRSPQVTNGTCSVAYLARGLPKQANDANSWVTMYFIRVANATIHYGI